MILWNLQRILNLDPLAYACDWVRDYLRTNAEVEESDAYGAADAGRHLCTTYFVPNNLSPTSPNPGTI